MTAFPIFFEILIYFLTNLILNDDKIYFGDFTLSIPDDFEKTHFEKLNKIFTKNKNEPYSINAVEQILNTIDEITLNDEFKSIMDRLIIFEKGAIKSDIMLKN